MNDPRGSPASAVAAGHSLRFNAAEWRVIALIFSGGLISYLDRAALGVLAPYVKHDLALSSVQIGLALSFFSVGYTAFAVIAGHLADRFGAKFVITVAMISWSLFCAGTSLATGLASLLVLRFFFGMSEAPWAGAVAKFTHDWFGERRFTTVSGLSGAGLPLGAGLTGPLVGMIALYTNWRWAFVALGLVGIVWVLLWMRFAQAQPPHAAAAPSTGPERVTEGDGDAAPGFLALLRDRAVLGTAISFLTYGYMLNFFLAWFPSYLVQERKLSFAQMSIVTAIPWIAGIVGIACGGILAAYLARRPGGLLQACKLIIVAGLAICAACILLVPLVASTVAAVALMALAIFGLYATTTSYGGIVVASVPPARLGVVIGFIVTMPSIGGIVAPSITGWLVDRAGNFSSAFPLASAVAFMGAVAVAILVKAGRTRTAEA